MSNIAKELNSLIAVPEDDIRPTARTAMQFARLLNEARTLLEGGSVCDDRENHRRMVNDFERRCREQVGPIIEKRPAGT